MIARTLVAIALAGITAACHRSEQDRIRTIREAVASEVATVHFAGDRWIGGSIPDRFMRHVLDQAAKGIWAQRREAERLAPDDARATILDATARAASRLALIRAAVTSADTSRMRDELFALAVDTRAIAHWHQGGGGAP